MSPATPIAFSSFPSVFLRESSLRLQHSQNPRNTLVTASELRVMLKLLQVPKNGLLVCAQEDLVFSQECSSVFPRMSQRTVATSPVCRISGSIHQFPTWPSSLPKSARNGSQLGGDPLSLRALGPAIRKGERFFAPGPPQDPWASLQWEVVGRERQCR